MGLNIQAADVVVHYDLPPTAKSLDQRISRARRQGRKDPVLSVKMICKGTIEVELDKIINKKEDMSLQTMPLTKLKEIL
jgi:SNF2 family DNA or RNA helicase